MRRRSIRGDDDRTAPARPPHVDGDGAIRGVLARSVFLRVGPFGMVPWWLIGPVIAAIQRKPKVDELPIVASAEGLRLGDELVPRAKLKSAVLRREGDHTFVLLRGGPRALGSRVDVEVPSDDAADELCRALLLDAKSTTVEFALFKTGRQVHVTLVIVVMAMMALLLGAAMVAVTMAAHGAGLPLNPPVRPSPRVHARRCSADLLSRTSKLRVGADGMVIRDGLRRGVFHSHDAISSVHAEGKSIILERGDADPLRYDVGELQGQDPRGGARAPGEVDRVAHRESARGVPRARRRDGRCRSRARPRAAHDSRVDLGARSRRRGGERHVSQRAPHEGSAHGHRREHERVRERAPRRSRRPPHEAHRRGEARLRVAAERCVLPDLRERMVRVIDTPSDEDLAAALEEAEANEASS